MPTITLDRKGFDKLMGREYPDDVLKEKISMLGTDLEKLDKDEIVVEIFPNRPDMLSMQGFVRSLRTFMGIDKGIKKYSARKPERDFRVIIDKSVEKVRPYTACAIVKNLKFDDVKIKEVIQLQEKLHTTFGRDRKKAAIGIYPFEKITLPISFVGKNPKDVEFVPLGMNRELSGLQILSQHPTGREYAHLLEGKRVFPFFMDATGEVLSMPPVINSHRTGKITDRTKDVFVECSGFDLNMLEICLNMVVTALADMGGEICSMELEYPDGKVITPDLEPRKMKVDLKYINKLLGLGLKEAEFKKLFEKMGFSYEKGKVIIPAYRTDIMHAVDLGEDIAIAYGYENFKAEIPNVSTIGEEDRFETFKKKAADAVVGLGFLETSNYHLTNKNDMNKKMGVNLDCVELMNASTLEYDVLRSWVTPGLMKILSQNTRHDYPQRIFEIGTVFRKEPKTETGVGELTRIACASCHKDANYTEIRQYLEYLLGSFGLEWKVKKTEHPSFIPGRVGRVSVKGKNVAYVGEIHPQILDNFGIEQPVCVFELNLTDLFGITKN